MKYRRLFWQIYPSFFLLLFIVLIGLGWSFSISLRNFHYQQTSSDLKARAQLVALQLQDQLWSADQSKLTDDITRLGQQSGTRITIIRKNGDVLADSHQKISAMDNHGQRPEVMMAQELGEGVSVRYSSSVQQQQMYFAIMVKDKTGALGTVRTAISMAVIDKTLGEIYRRLMLIGLIIALLIIPAAWYLSRRISRPLELMTSAAQRFSQGELDAPLAETGSVETGRLARALNSMAEDLSRMIQREVEQRSEMEAILGCMVEGIIAVDKNALVLRLNAAAARMFGVKHFKTGRPIEETIRHSELQRFIHRALKDQDQVEDELVLTGMEKRYLHIQATPLAGPHGKPIGILIVLHDLTRLRQLESVRRDFVANVSHELKTPITAIRGAVETLLDEAEFEGDSYRFLQIIFKQGERLNALIEDLLELSRIEQGVNQGGWVLHNQLLLPVLEGARTACESLINQRQVTVDLRCSPDLSAAIHPHLLEQAVINLISNAVKYSDHQGQIIVEARRGEEQIVIQVQDFGCGIDEKHLPRIFERFYRADPARSRSLGGTGLGLAIVKHVAYAHQGDVSVSSTPGQGSTFSIRLPLHVTESKVGSK